MGFLVPSEMAEAKNSRWNLSKFERSSTAAWQVAKAQTSWLRIVNAKVTGPLGPVSYTHLDVYKRQFYCTVKRVAPNPPFTPNGQGMSTLTHSEAGYSQPAFYAE